MTAKNQIKAAGYVRVSSTGQIDNESLTTQRNEIKKFAKANDYKLTEIYADEGISGGSVKERHALLKALHDARKGTFDVLIIRDLSRFGRNAQELLNNHLELKKHGIVLRSVKEGINFDSHYGKAMLTMLAAIAELELNMIKERMLDNRIAKALRGIPTAGRLPFGREFDDEKEEWSINEEAKKGIEWAADQFLNKGTPMQDISQVLQSRFNLPLSYSHLLNVLKEHSGDTWQIEFEELDEPITYNVPRLLSDATIQRIKDRLAHNRTNNRADVQNKYLLTGFIRCIHCKKGLSGQIQQGKYAYYVHQSKKDETCNHFTTIPLQKIEEAVFKTIFENITDIPSFEAAINDSLPDEQYINDLQQAISIGQKELSKIDKKLDKLVDLALSGTLEKSTIKEREQNLIQAKHQVIEEISEAQYKLDNLPDPEDIKREADDIRKMLKREYQSEEHVQNMSFDDKKRLLHFLFDGKAPNGDKYGIYVDKKGKGKDAEIDYFMFGRLTGLRTIKGDDIDYFPDDDNDDGDGNGGNSSTSESRSAHRNSDYKTNIFSSLKK